MLERRAGVLRCAALWSPGEADPGALARLSDEIALGWGIDLPGRVWATGRPVFVPAVRRDPNMPRGAAAGEAGAVAAYGLPLLDGGEPVGVLELFLPDPASPTPETEHRLAAVAEALVRDGGVERLSAALRPIGADERELQRRAAQQAAVAEFGRHALTSTDLDPVLEDAVQLVRAMLGVEHTSILTLHEDERQLVVRAGAGWQAGVVGAIVPALRESLAGYALMRGEPVVVDDLAAETRFASSPILGEHEIVSSAAVVIRGPTGAVGVLAAHSRLPGRFGRQDVHFMRTVANVVAGAMLRSRVEDELRRANALLDAIVAGTTDSIYVKDLEGRILFANAAGAASLGRTPPELLGRRPSELDQGLADLEPEDLAVMDSGEWRTEEGEIEIAGGRRWYSTTRGPYRAADGRVVGVIGLARDVTDRRLAERRTRVLAEAGRLLATATDLEGALAETADLPVPQVCDLCEVALVDPDGGVRTVAIGGRDDEVTRAARELRERYPTDPSADAGIAAVLRTGEATLMRGLTADALAAMARDDEHRRLLARVPVTSAVIVPLMARGRTLGTLTMATLPGRPQLDEFDLDLGMELAGRAALATDSARLFAERQRTLDTLQRALLPPQLPDVPGLELGAEFHAGREGLDVGGDFYDVLPSGEGWLVVVGDVCGRGAEAATITAVARHTLRGAAMYDDDPGSLLRALNSALLRERLDLRFCTVLCVRLERTAGGFAARLANGGHPGALICRRDGEAQLVEAPGTLIGVLPQADVGTASFELAPGDSLVLYTDGLLDIRRQNGIVRALDLGPLIARVSREGAGAIASALAADALAAAGGGGLGDDVAVLALRVLDGGDGA